MAFTAGELANIAASALDYAVKNPKGAFAQTVADKPLYKHYMRSPKKFPGGKGNITVPVRLSYGAGGTNDTVKGYTHDDTVAYFNDANTLTASYAWREVFLGLAVTHTELKIAGLSVSDDGQTSSHTNREVTILADLYEEKINGLLEQWARGVDFMLHSDGTADTKGFVGIKALIAANPTTGTVGGLSRATYSDWRNIAYTAAHAGAGGTGAITSNTANGGALVQALGVIYRQATRFNGKPTLFIAGSDFLGAYETELRANGNYSMTGFTGTQDASMGDLAYKGCVIRHDSALDVAGLSKRAYWIDTNAVQMYAMDGEWERTHTPQRPTDKMVLYRGMSSTGQLVAKQLNSSAVIDIA